jgi:hypothetical protein
MKTLIMKMENLVIMILALPISMYLSGHLRVDCSARSTVLLPVNFTTCYNIIST